MTTRTATTQATRSDPIMRDVTGLELCGCDPHEEKDGIWVSRCPACKGEGYPLRVERNGDGGKRIACENGCDEKAVADAMVQIRKDSESVVLENITPESILNTELHLKCINIRDLFTLPIPEREALIEPILYEQDIGMLAAWRGLGKTLFSLNMALLVASGAQWHTWKAPKPRRILYVDGELPFDQLREHVKTVVKANRYDCDPNLFRILTCDVQENAYPNIAERDGQELIEEHLDGVAAVFLDNLNALGGASAESNPEDWEKVRSWQLKLRREGIASILVHHTGKNKDQRGLSAKEDVLDWSLKLEHPSDYREDQGARFNVRFTKMRRQAAVPPFEAWLEPGRYLWTIRQLEDVTYARILELHREGYTQRKIPEILKEEGIRTSSTSVNRAIKRGEREGKV